MTICACIAQLVSQTDLLLHCLCCRWRLLRHIQCIVRPDQQRWGVSLRFNRVYASGFHFISSHFLSSFLPPTTDDLSLSSSTTMAHPPARTHTYRPLSKSPSDNGAQLGAREPSPTPVPPPPPPMPSLLQLRARDSDRERSVPDL